MLGQALLTAFEKQRERPAFIADDAATDYATLAHWSRQLASIFKNRYGWKSGDCIAVQLPNTAYYAAVFAGLTLNGAAILPLNLNSTPAEVETALNKKPLAGLLLINALVPRWNACPQFSSLPKLSLETLVECLSTVSKNEPELCSDELGSRDALCLMTSGTTDTPKLVIRTQSSLMENARNLAEVLRLEPGCMVLPVTPFSHANGFSNGMLFPLLSGACLIPIAQFFPARLLDTIRRRRPEVMIASPLVYAALLRHGVTASDLATLRCCISSGAPLPAETSRDYRNLLGVPIRQLYGSSETGTISISSADDTDEDTAGTPLPAVEVRLLSEDGQPLPTGQLGQVAVRSRALMKGYWDPSGILPVRTEEGFYLTGDLGMMDSRGRLKLKGRIRKTLNVGGSKVSPAEVEEVLGTMPGVLRCRISPIDHRLLNQVLEATIYALPDSGVTQASIMEYCRRYLSEYKIPRRINLEYRAASDLPEK